MQPNYYAHLVSFINQVAQVQIKPSDFKRQVAFQKQDLANLTRDSLKILVEQLSTTVQTRQPWSHGQMRLFVWFIFKYSQVIKKHDENFTKKHWQYVSSLFQSHTPEECRQKWQAMKAKPNPDAFQPIEDQMLCQIVQKKQSKKIPWNEIKKDMFQRSNGKFVKKPKQYRQRWINHLDPNIKRGPFSTEEDLQLVRFVVKVGKKWSAIGKFFQRTENSVKNEYNRLIKKYEKKTGKVLQDSEPWQLGPKLESDLLLQIQKQKSGKKDNTQIVDKTKQQENSILKKPQLQKGKEGQPVNIDLSKQLMEMVPQSPFQLAMTSLSPYSPYNTYFFSNIFNNPVFPLQDVASAFIDSKFLQ